MTVDGRGSFERVTRGTVSGGRWEQGDYERVNAARFFEVYLAPGETGDQRHVQGPVEPIPGDDPLQPDAVRRDRRHR